MSHPVRIALFCLAFAVGGSAAADELTDANLALQQKNYPVALKLFGKLAATNNNKAQLRLGEMYWYGEGVQADRAKADALFAQAAASGDPAAVAATKLSGNRTAHAADIALWTGGYTGADLRSGQFDCKAPAVPENRSTGNEEIKRMAADIGTWNACYKGFVANMASVMPPGKAIPGDIAELMNEQEVKQAAAHLGQVYQRVIAAAKAEAEPVIARHDKWEKATVDYVRTENEQNLQRTLASKRDMQRIAGARTFDKTMNAKPTPGARNN